MFQSKITKYLASAVAVLFLTILAWWALEGAFRQWSHSNTIGQQLETVIQFICGILSFITIITLFRWKEMARTIRLAWAISFVSTAGLSSLVWGPPMPVVSLAFAGVSLLMACGVIWIIRKIEKTN